MQPMLDLDKMARAMFLHKSLFCTNSCTMVLSIQFNSIWSHVVELTLDPSSMSSIWGRPVYSLPTAAEIVASDDGGASTPSVINGSLTVPAVVLVANGTVFLALPPLTLTGKASLAASLAAMSTLPTEPGLDFQPAVDSFSPLWLHRPAPPYCGASHTNDRKATGSCLQQRVYLPLAVLLRYLSASPRWRRLPPHSTIEAGGWPEGIWGAITCCCRLLPKLLKRLEPKKKPQAPLTEDRPEQVLLSVKRAMRR